MAFTGRIGRIRAFINRASEKLRRPASLVLRAKEMLRTISPETLMAISPRPTLALAGQPHSVIPHDIDRPYILKRSGRPEGANFNIRQIVLSEASFQISQAGAALSAKMNNAAMQKISVQEGTRKSWVAEWKRVFDAQIARIKTSNFSKEEKVTAIRELIDDIKHHIFLTDKEKKDLIATMNQDLALFSEAKTPPPFRF